MGEGKGSEGVDLKFGDHIMEVLEKMGNPNKEYVNEQTVAKVDVKEEEPQAQPQNVFWLNYLELGIDVGLGALDSRVQKIIVRANHPEDANFAFYDRCWF